MLKLGTNNESNNPPLCSPYLGSSLKVLVEEIDLINHVSG